MSHQRCPATKGTIHEFLVAVDALRQGFRVYRNISGGPVDLILTKPGLMLRVQVKTQPQRSALRGNDVLAIVTKDGRIRYRARTRRVARKFENCTVLY